MSIDEREIEEIRKEIPKQIQDEWIRVENSFKNEDGTYIDFIELDELLFKIIKFYRKSNKR